MWEKGAIKEASASDFQSIAIYTATGGQTDKSKSTNYGTLKDATIKEVGVVNRPATDVKTPTWETKTVTIRNVSPGSRIGVGAVRGKSGNQRWLLNSFQVKVMSYGVPTLTTPVLKSKEISKTKASFVFESQEMAQGYRLGYKVSGMMTTNTLNRKAQSSTSAVFRSIPNISSKLWPWPESTNPKILIIWSSRRKV